MRGSELGLNILGRLINWEGGAVERYVQGNHAVESSRQWGLNKLFLTEAAVKFSYFATQNNTIGPGKSLPPALKLTCFKREFHVWQSIWVHNIPLKQVMKDYWTMSTKCLMKMAKWFTTSKGMANMDKTMKLWLMFPLRNVLHLKLKLVWEREKKKKTKAVTAFTFHRPATTEMKGGDTFTRSEVFHAAWWGGGGEDDNL